MGLMTSQLLRYEPGQFSKGLWSPSWYSYLLKQAGVPNLIQLTLHFSQIPACPCLVVARTYWISRCIKNWVARCKRQEKVWLRHIIWRKNNVRWKRQFQMVLASSSSSRLYPELLLPHTNWCFWENWGLLNLAFVLSNKIWMNDLWEVKMYFFKRI